MMLKFPSRMRKPNKQTVQNCFLTAAVLPAKFKILQLLQLFQTMIVRQEISRRIEIQLQFLILKSRLALIQPKPLLMNIEI